MIYVYQHRVFILLSLMFIRSCRLYITNSTVFPLYMEVLFSQQCKCDVSLLHCMTLLCIKQTIYAALNSGHEETVIPESVAAIRFQTALEEIICDK